MKKTIILLLSLFLFVIVHSQVSKTIHVITAGTLNSYLKNVNKSTITNITLTGNIDARDIKMIRDSILNLTVLDVSATTIKEYEGSEGTLSPQTTLYSANEFPPFSFYNGFITKASIIKSILLPNSITSIGADAFSNCFGLTYIEIPNSVTIIGDGSFDGCTCLSKISMPNSVKTIGRFAFYKCGLEDLTLPDSVSEIGEYAFAACTLISNDLVIPTTLSNIGVSTFQSCSGIKGSLVLPNTISVIGENAFNGCTGFSGGLLIPNSVISIGSHAFFGCTGLTSITIPQSVKSIGSWAFCYNYKLDSIHANSLEPIDLSSVSGVFKDIDKTSCILYVPLGSASAYKAAGQWKDFKNLIEEQVLPLQNLRFIDIYPNFVSDKFKINGINEACRICIFDLNGKVLLTNEIKPNEYVSINSFAKGEYLVKISTRVGWVTRKILKIEL